MDQTNAKALAAIQPFVYEANTNKNPSARYLSDLITRATSAPGTYVFTELLQSPATQSLHTLDSGASKSYLTLLEIFSWGTYQEYTETPNLPTLNDAQIQKLRQLTLLTLASPFAPASDVNQPDSALSYTSLIKHLSLPSTSALESLLTSTIYSGLLTARLSPTSNPPMVHITSVAPLRDLRPQSLPAMLQILSTWESRCTNVISELEAQVTFIRESAISRNTQTKRRQEVIDSAVIGTDMDKISGSNRLNRNRLGNKRDLDERMKGEDNEDSISSDEVQMDVDEGLDMSIGHGTGAVGSSREAKRNRGRG